MCSDSNKYATRKKAFQNAARTLRSGSFHNIGEMKKISVSGCCKTKAVQRLPSSETGKNIIEKYMESSQR
jgi:hypothetical protein